MSQYFNGDSVLFIDRGFVHRQRDLCGDDFSGKGDAVLCEVSRSTVTWADTLDYRDEN